MKLKQLNSLRYVALSGWCRDNESDCAAKVPGFKSRPWQQVLWLLFLFCCFCLKYTFCHDNLQFLPDHIFFNQILTCITKRKVIFDKQQTKFCLSTIQYKLIINENNYYNITYYLHACSRLVFVFRDMSRGKMQ